MAEPQSPQAPGLGGALEGQQLLGILRNMPPEQRAQYLRSMGMPDFIAGEANARDKAMERAAALRNPTGQMVRNNIYQAASPLEHLATGLQRGMALRDMKQRQGNVDDMMKEWKGNSNILSDAIGGSAMGMPEPGMEQMQQPPIQNTPDVQSFPGGEAPISPTLQNPPPGATPYPPQGAAPAGPPAGAGGPPAAPAGPPPGAGGPPPAGDPQEAARAATQQRIEALRNPFGEFGDKASMYIGDAVDWLKGLNAKPQEPGYKAMGRGMDNLPPDAGWHTIKSWFQ